MPNINLQKGNKLEEAVEQIERKIFLSNPSLKESKSYFERKKIIKADGVTHEVDLHIRVDSGNGYESIYIFECKNWEAKVDKNEIIIFSYKINETKATRGFFVAKKFTKDAIAQAKLDKRIELVTASDLDIDLSIFPEMHTIWEEKNERKIYVKPFYTGEIESGEEFKKFESGKLIYQGKDINPQEFFVNLSDLVVEKRMAEEQTHLLVEGKYKYKHETDFNYKKEELILDGNEIEKIRICVEFEQQVIKSSIVSKFDIHTRGRFLEQEFKMPHKTRLNIKLITNK